jgi:adenosine/AMP kinase
MVAHCTGLRNREGLIEEARQDSLSLACGHTFVVLMKGAFPINVLNAVKAVQEVCGIFCATANPLQVIVAETEQGRGIMGVIDGFSPRGAEGPAQVEERRKLLRRFGYKL